MAAHGIEAIQSRALRLSFIPGASPNRRRCSLQSQGKCFRTMHTLSRAGQRPSSSASGPGEPIDHHNRARLAPLARCVTGLTSLRRADAHDA